MPAYLGTLGRLVPIRCTAQPVSASDRYTFERTLEGKVKAQRKATVRRSWAVSAGLATADQIAALWGIADGEWGKGPFVWITPEAQVTNLLTPEIASCSQETLFSPTTRIGGPMLLEDGMFAGRSLMVDSATAWSFVGSSRVPVLRDQKVTGSMSVLGAGAIVRLSWYGPDGVAISHTESSMTGAAGTPRRLHVTDTPPAGAVSCLLATRGALQAARPSVTWTREVQPYGSGSGCAAAVIDGLERDPRLLTSAHYRASASFTIAEVG